MNNTTQPALPPSSPTKRDELPHLVKALQQRARADAALAFLLEREQGRDYNCSYHCLETLANFNSYMQYSAWFAP
jgi:hypothetical protein